MTIAETVQQDVDICVRRLAAGNFVSCASEISDLLSAEEAGIISSDWRMSVDPQAVEGQVKNHKSDILEEWNSVHGQVTKEVLEDGALDEFDVLVTMSGRSTMRSLARFLDPEATKTSREFDAAFVQYLKDNRKDVLAWRKDAHPSLNKLLPEHWWWHRDIDDM